MPIFAVLLHFIICISKTLYSMRSSSLLNQRWCKEQVMKNLYFFTAVAYIKENQKDCGWGKDITDVTADFLFPRHEQHGITRPADSGIIYRLSGVKYPAEEVLINISPSGEPAEAGTEWKVKYFLYVTARKTNNTLEILSHTMFLECNRTSEGLVILIPRPIISSVLSYNSVIIHPKLKIHEREPIIFCIKFKPSVEKFEYAKEQKITTDFKQITTYISVYSSLKAIAWLGIQLESHLDHF